MIIALLGLKVKVKGQKSRPKFEMRLVGSRKRAILVAEVMIISHFSSDRGKPYLVIKVRQQLLCMGTFNNSGGDPGLPEDGMGDHGDGAVCRGRCAAVGDDKLSSCRHVVCGAPSTSHL